MGKIREERELRGENGKRGTEILRRYVLAGHDRAETAENLENHNSDDFPEGLIFPLQKIYRYRSYTGKSES